MGLNFTSIQLIPLSTYEILLNSKGIMGTFVSHFLLKEKMTCLDKLVSIVAFIGMILVVKPDLIMSWFTSTFEFHDQNRYGNTHSF